MMSRPLRAASDYQGCGFRASKWFNEPDAKSNPPMRAKQNEKMMKHTVCKGQSNVLTGKCAESCKPVESMSQNYQFWSGKIKIRDLGGHNHTAAAEAVGVCAKLVGQDMSETGGT
jgi:hypothetical protein